MKKKNKKYREYLFVDGYNIINSWDNLKDLCRLDLELARNELIETMAEYQQYSGIKVIVVFDAHMVKGNIGNEENIKGIHVVYTKENETADQYIERTLDSYQGKKLVRVATSDWLEQQIVLGRGGTRISARELQVEIFNQKNLMMKKKNREGDKSQLFMGRLDENILEKLKRWKNKDE